MHAIDGSGKLPSTVPQALDNAVSTNPSQQQVQHAGSSAHATSSFFDQNAKNKLAKSLGNDDEAISEEPKVLQTTVKLYSGTDRTLAGRTINQNTFSTFKKNFPVGLDPDEEDFFKYLDKHLPSPPKKHGTWCRIKTRLFKLPGAATTSEKGKGKDTGTVQAPRTFAELQKAPDGTNVTQLFLNDPGKFLKKVPTFEHLQTMREYEQLDEGLKRAGKVHFILESYGGGKAAKLKPVLNTYGDAVEQTKLQQQLAEGPQFQAHWLPWKPGATTHITLDPTCAFFFTSQLAGCRLAMRRDDPIRPQIAHIAGSGERGATTATWRKRETERLYGHLSRAEILTGGSGSDLPSDSRYIGEGVNLVGVFGAAKDAWEFTMQKLDFDTFAVKEARPWGRQRAEQG